MTTNIASQETAPTTTATSPQVRAERDAEKAPSQSPARQASSTRNEYTNAGMASGQNVTTAAIAQPSCVDGRLAARPSPATVGWWYFHSLTRAPRSSQRAAAAAHRPSRGRTPRIADMVGTRGELVDTPPLYRRVDRNRLSVRSPRDNLTDTVEREE